MVERFSKIIPKIRRLHTNGLNLNKTVNYKGKFPPDELPDILDGNLGLIWDGSYNDEDEAYCLKNYST